MSSGTDMTGGRVCRRLSCAVLAMMLGGCEEGGGADPAARAAALDDIAAMPAGAPVVLDAPDDAGALGQLLGSGLAGAPTTASSRELDPAIRASYGGQRDCPPKPGTPVAIRTSAVTAEDVPVMVTLRAQSSKPATLRFALESPAHGDVAFSGPSTCVTTYHRSTCQVTVRYTPQPDFNGRDRFAFTASDGANTSAKAMADLVVTEVNDPPALADDAAATRRNTAVAIPVATLLANDRPGPANESSQTLRVTRVDAGHGGHGTAVLAHGAITYTPEVGFLGVATLRYTACDNGTTAGCAAPRCSTGAIAITIAAADQPPQATPQTVTVAEDSSTAVTLSGTDADRDRLAFAVVDGPGHGTLSGTAPDLVYTPAPDYFGPDSFRFRANDGAHDSEPATVAIAVTEVNDPPLPAADRFAVGADESSRIPIAAVVFNDRAGPPNEVGQHLTLRAVSATHGAATVEADAVVYTPDPGFHGTAAIAYEVCDDGTTAGRPDPRCSPDGRIALDVISADRRPTADPQTLITQEDVPVPVALTGSDPDGDALTYAIVRLPEHGVLSGVAPNLRYTPAADYFGPDAFTFTVSDGRSISTPATIGLEVTEVNDPPVLGPDAVTLGGAGTLPPPPERPTCGPVCGVLYGDPHVRTFDRGFYDFQAVGEFIAARSTTDDFEVQVRTTPVPPARQVSIVTGVAMRVAGHRVSLTRTLAGLDARVDGVVTAIEAIPTALPGGGWIGTYGTTDQIFVGWPDGAVAIVQNAGFFPAYYRFSVYLGLSGSRLRRVVGVLGNADGEVNNDLTSRDGATVLPYPNPPFAREYPAYADSWRISQAESLFDYGPGQSTETFTDRTYPDAPVTAASLPAGTRSTATAVCGLYGIVLPEVLDACVVDVGVTGDAEFANSASGAQGAALGVPQNTGTTSIGTPTPVVIGAAGETAVRSFAGVAGQAVTLAVADNTISPVQLTVRSPTGSFVASLSASGSTALHDVFSLPATGTYTVTVAPSAGLVGSLTFEIDSVPGNTGTTSIGTPTPIAIGTIGESAARSFAGTAGQRLTLSVSQNTIAGVSFVIRTPSGGLVTSTFISATTAFLDTFSLPVTGTYTIAVDPSAQSTGSLTFELDTVPDNTGTAAIGAPTLVVIGTPGENAVRSFDGTAGQRLTLSVSQNTIASVSFVIRTPSGGFVASTSTSGPSVFLDAFPLPVTGTYTLTVDPSARSTGSLNFELDTVPDNTGTAPIGTPTPVVIGTPGENAVRSFDGTAGQRLTLSVSQNTIASVSFVIRTPSGGFVASTSTSGPSVFLDAFPLPVTGTYTLTVDPSAQSTGSLSFELDTVPDNTGTAPIGTPTPVVIGTPGENAVRSFDGTAGQRLTLSVSQNTIASVSFVIRTPLGGFVASTSTSGPSVFLDAFPLPVTGTYTITVDPSARSTGSLSFELDAVPDNTGTTSIGTPTPVAIGTIGENAVRSFDGTAGQRLTLSVSQNTIASVSFVIRTPSGGFVASTSTSGPSVFLDAFPLPVTGTYTITVDPSARSTGSLSFELDAVPDNTGTTSIGTPTPVAIGTIGENAVRSFDGTAGQRLTLSVSQNTIASVSFVIRTPSGGFVASTSTSGPSVFLGAFPLPVTGTYTITVDPSGRSTGSLSFELDAVAGIHAPLGGASERGPPELAVLPLASATPGPTLHLAAADVLANDRPGPANEADQTLTVTAVTAGPDSHGTASFDGATIVYTPDLGFVGTATVAYTACDNGTTAGQPDPKCSDGAIAIRVTANTPPVVNAQRVTTAEDTPVPITLTGSDADGDALVFVIEEPPAHGTLGGTAPHLVYTPVPDYSGPDAFRVTANDTHDPSAPATVSITVTPVNDPPAPEPDTVIYGVGQVATVTAASLATNDAPGPFDERAQALAVTAVAATVDSHGTVALSAGTIRYTPDAGFTGTATVAYTVCDDGQPDPQCAQGQLRLVANRAPAAVPGAVATAHDTAAAITLAATDPEGDALGFQVEGRPQHGVVTGAGATVMYVPQAGFVGTDSFTFTASDAFSTSPAATVTIVVTATAPPILRPDIVATAANTPVRIDVLANDAAGDGTLAPATLAIARPPTNGTAAVDNGAVRYTPAPGVTPDDHFTYRVCDTFAVCGAAEVTIVVVVPNRPPVATADSYSVDQGRALAIATPGVLGNDSDPDPGDAIGARLDVGVSAGNLLLRFDGSFNYTPADGFAGLDRFTYHVVDRAGLSSAPVTVTIDVVPPGPLAVDDEYTTTTDNPLIVFAAGVLANDRDAHASDVLTAALSRAPLHGRVGLVADGSFVYTPDPGFTGDDSFLYTVTDVPGLASTPARVTVHVDPPGGPVPAIAAVSPASGAWITTPTRIIASITPPANGSIDRWSVVIRNLDRGAPAVLASGSGAPPATLGTFDPTTLCNGGYEVLVRVEARGGGTTTAVADVVVAGEMKLGDYTTTYLDLETSIVGFPVQVLRTYDTTDPRRGDFGIGWRVEISSYRATPNNRLGQGGWSTEPFGFPFTRFAFTTSIPHFVTVTSPDGSVEVFDFVPAPSGPLLSLTSPAFVAQPGTRTTSTLEDVDAPVLALSGDSIVSFFGGTLYDPQRFRLTTRDGRVLIIDRDDGLQSIADRNGNQLIVSADGVHSPATARELSFARDGARRITEVRAPGGKITRYSYSAAGDLSSFTGVDGTSDTFAYDSRHRLLSIDGSGGVRVRTLSYGPDGRFTSLTDAVGNTTQLSSDLAARREVVTTPSGRLTTLSTYGADGNLASTEEVFDGHARLTRYAYDSESRPTRTTTPLGRVELRAYDAAGNIVSWTTSNHERWTFAYNALNELTTTTAPDGTVYESNAYDERGNLVSTTTGDGSTTIHSYSDRGLRLATTDAFGLTTYAYDTDHQLTAMTDANGRIASYGYDAAGNLATVTATDGGVTRYAWSALGKLLQATDARGSTQTFAYDAFGRLTTQTDPIGRVKRYAYDDSDRLVSSTDRNGQTTSYAYDKDGYLSRVAYADGDAVAIASDPLGRRTSISDADTVVQRTYDDDDHVLGERTAGNGGVALPDVTLSYVTDGNGNTTDLDGAGGHVGYTYDSRGRLASVTDPLGGRFTMRYDGADRLVELSRPNGVRDTSSYLAGSLESRTASAGAQVLARASYTFDSLRRRTSLTDLDGTHAFTHDDGDRLTGATHPAPSGLADETFEYDRVGNRLAWRGSPAAAVSYDAADQLLGDGTYDYRYDAEGRVVERRELATGNATQYRWSSAGRLTSVEGTSGHASYRYDALGRRVEVDDNGTVSRFVYHGWNVHLVYGGDNAVEAVYVPGVDLGTPLEVQRGAAVYFPLVDGADSTTALTDIAGAVVGRTRFSAFGAPEVSGIADATLSFGGHQFDATTGLHYARSRYYDATTGRFLSQDPEPSINPYPYALDAPLEYTDPTGRSETAEYTINIECRGWDAEQLADATIKIESYQRAARDGKLVYSLGRNSADVAKAAAKAQKAYRKTYGLRGTGMDADHLVELVLGGAADALFGIDATVNRSFGGQIGNELERLRRLHGKLVVGTPVKVVAHGCK